VKNDPEVINSVFNPLRNFEFRHPINMSFSNGDIWFAALGIVGRRG